MHNLVKDEIPEEDEAASPGCDNYYASLPTSIMDNHGLGRGGVNAGVSPQSHHDWPVALDGKELANLRMGENATHEAGL